MSRSRSRAAGPATDKSLGEAVLGSVAPLLQRQVDLDELLAVIVGRVADALSADRGTIYLLERNSGALVSRAARLPEIKEIRLQPGQGIAGQAAAEGNTINLSQAEGDKRFFKDIDKQTGYRTRSVLATPLIDRGGRTIGVLQVLNAKGGKFSAQSEDAIKRLAAEVTTAIEYTSLYPELRRSVKDTREKRRTPKPKPVAPVHRYNGIVGNSSAMRTVYETLARAAPTDATVLLRGETGTGKGLVASALHVNSKRREGPFVKVDCGTIPAALMENELFGHERGAFTGADARVVGKCEAADGGTLFLDEIGELPAAVQPKLLRFIQDHTFERVGGTKTLTADVRVVVATHRDLESMVGHGTFRSDLYYRIRVVELVLPPLRQRGPDDKVRLAEHFLDLYARKHRQIGMGFSQDALAVLSDNDHAWPGNIREFENCIERAVVLCDGDTIEAHHLSISDDTPPPVPRTKSNKRAFVPQPLAYIEQAHILATLNHTGGNRSEAAELLGISRATLYRRLADYGID